MLINNLNNQHQDQTSKVMNQIIYNKVLNFHKVD